MTGFGKSVCEFQNKKIVAEIKSLNSNKWIFQLEYLVCIMKKILKRSRIAQVLETRKVDFALYTDTQR